MKCLFLDSSTSLLTVALIIDNKVSFVKQKEVTNSSEYLLQFIIEGLQSNSVSIWDIDKIIVSNGPGSFTGIRVAVTLAKTISYSIKKPVYPISSLKVIASGSNSDIIVPIIDARRGYVYAGIYDENLNNIMEDTYISLENLTAKLKNLNCEIISLDDIENSKKPDYDFIKISNLKLDEVNCHNLNPNYLKKTEAEEKHGI